MKQVENDSRKAFYVMLRLWTLSSGQLNVVAGF